MHKIAKTNFYVIVILSMFCLFGCDTREKSSLKSDSFTIAVLPDTQIYSEKYPNIFLAQTNWIAKNAVALKLLCVVQEGDIVNNDIEYQWQNADKAISVLDKNKIPYCIAIGNHDCVDYKHNKRNSDNFNKYFGTKRIANKKWYGGSLNNQSENSYYFFESAGKKIMVLCLEFGPRDEVLDWANQLAEKYADRHIIVVTHGYMNNDDTRLSPGDNHNPHDYLKEANDGEDMWEKFVRRHNNIFLVLSGHVVGDGNGKLTSYSDDKTKVTQILANYQMKENGGNGWLRLMKFVPAEDKIAVETYSPYLKEYSKDPNNSFTVEDVGLFKKAAN
ncbi:MAG: metallophosphoesterase [Planctomycetaceae bacterium]|nr:metallophosphoesterase [Planctomycetaceae bacterium]